MTLTETSQYLREHDNFLILTHRNPDGDTLGSAAGLCLGLRSLNKNAYVAHNPDSLGRFEALVAALKPSSETPIDTIVSVDTASVHLFPKAFSQYQDKVDLQIDHHPGERSYAKHALVDPACAATGELICLIFQVLGVTLTQEIAKPLYVAIVTDTGCLRYENTTSRTLRAAADLKDTGLQTASINNELFETKTLSRLGLEAALHEDLEMLEQGRIAVMRLTKAKLLKTSAKYDDTDGVSSLARQIAGVDIGVTLREETDSVKISLRTSPGFDAGKICAHLQGGGHARAAGCIFAGELDGARVAILQAIYAQYPLANWDANTNKL